MKTIDERADSYCREQAYQGGYDVEDVRAAYLKGAQDERDEITRWNDPKDELPYPQQPVIVCTSPKIYFIATYDTEFGCWFTEDGGACGRCEIMGWRKIHE